LAALAFLAEKRIAVATLPPHLTHVMARIDVCLDRLTGPGRAGGEVPLGPDAEAEDDARAETDFLKPAGIPPQKCLPGMGDLNPSVLRRERLGLCGSLSMPSHGLTVVLMVLVLACTLSP
jgi:hypothetical protein